MLINCVEKHKNLSLDHLYALERLKSEVWNIRERLKKSRTFDNRIT